MLGELDAALSQILLRGEIRCQLEGAREMELAQPDRAGDAGQGQILLQMRVDEILRPAQVVAGQPAPKQFSRAARDAVVPDEMQRERLCQGLRVEASHRLTRERLRQQRQPDLPY